MNAQDVAKMVKRLRGIYPARPYNLDEELVITTWRANQELLAHDAELLPAMYERVMKHHDMFPALSDVLKVLRLIKRGNFNPIEMPDYADTRVIDFGPAVYAGYVEGVNEINQQFYRTRKPLDYMDFMQEYYPREHKRLQSLAKHTI